MDSSSGETKVKEQYDLAVKLLKQYSEKLNITFEEFQKLHRLLIELSDIVENSNNYYSSNESIDEISSIFSLKLLLVPYLHFRFIDSKAVSSQLGNNMANSEKRNKLRLLVLKIVENMVWKFLKLLVLDMKLFDVVQNGLNVETFHLLLKWINNYNDLRQEEIANNGTNGFVKLSEVESLTFKTSGAVGRRDMKIGKWKLEKELNDKVKILDEVEKEKGTEAEAETEKKDDDDIFESGGFTNGLDENILRKVWLDKITLAVVDSIGILENTEMEREMLESMQKLREINDDDDESLDLSIDGLKLSETEKEYNDKRNRSKQESRFDKGYTDKVENFRGNEALLSKEGKVLRPFTIVSSDQKRKELQQRVMGTGQYLPTMSVEELVDWELQNGGMVKPSEPEPEVDEDDYKWQDKETYRLREWDEFTDANRKGSGNTKGNLG